MGRNLALNIESRGYAVSVYNRSREKTDELIAEFPGRNLVPTYTLEEFVASLETPRRILMMVKAGEATDATIASLAAAREGRRADRRWQYALHRHDPPQPGAAQSGLHFIGTGVSGAKRRAARPVDHARRPA